MKTPQNRYRRLLCFSTKFSNCVVCDEPVVDVEHDEKGGEAGDGEDIKDARVVDHKSDSVLAMMKLHCNGDNDDAGIKENSKLCGERELGNRYYC